MSLLRVNLPQTLLTVTDGRVVGPCWEKLKRKGPKGHLGLIKSSLLHNGGNLCTSTFRPHGCLTCVPDFANVIQTEPHKQLLPSHNLGYPWLESLGTHPFDTIMGLVEADLGPGVCERLCLFGLTYMPV